MPAGWWRRRRAGGGGCAPPRAQLPIVVGPVPDRSDRGRRGDVVARRPSHAGGTAVQVHALDGAMEHAVDGLGQPVDQRLPSHRGGGGHGLPVEAATDQHGDHGVGERPVAAVTRAADGAEQGAVDACAEGARILGPGLVAPAGGLEGVEDGRVGVVQRGELVDPDHQGGHAVGIGPDGVQPSSQRHHLATELATELREDVVLAREVLVERGPGAAGPLGDELDPGLVEPDLGEHIQCALEYPPLGLAAPLAHRRVRPEGCPPHHARPSHGSNVTHGRWRRPRREPQPMAPDSFRAAIPSQS